MIPIHTPKLKKIYPTASAQIVPLVSLATLLSSPEPTRYYSIPSLAPGSYTTLISIITIRTTGRGTVHITIFDIDLVPFLQAI